MAKRKGILSILTEFFTTASVGEGKLVYEHCADEYKRLQARNGKTTTRTVKPKPEKPEEKPVGAVAR